MSEITLTDIWNLLYVGLLFGAAVKGFGDGLKR